ncbi:hypothetical protein wVul_0338 [Wolbachia endosymbiont of Armadillidium vulgare str. wVulC]|nr:hypothetical protein wVul_0338 [Wolbachia endosymbiont of Armadillidium vulgare str. wVulC]
MGCIIGEYAQEKLMRKWILRFLKPYGNGQNADTLIKAYAGLRRNTLKQKKPEDGALQR